MFSTVLILDADDKIAPTFISRLLPKLLADSSIGFCYSRVRFFGAKTGKWACPEYDPRRLLVENLSPATAVVRRSAFDLVGGYRQDMTYGFEDWDLWLAFEAAGYGGTLVAEPLFFYRKHPVGRSMLDRTQSYRLEMMRKMIEHHRPLYVSLFAEGSELTEPNAATRFDKGVRSLDDDILRLLLVEAQLNHIENSRAWRMVGRIRKVWLYHLGDRARPASHDQPDEVDDSGRARLNRIKQSLSYRLIQAVKKTTFYPRYAEHRYGPTWRNH